MARARVAKPKLSSDMEYWLRIGGKVFYANDPDPRGPLVGYILSYDRGNARKVAKANGLTLGPQVKTRAQIAYVVETLPEIGGKVAAGDVVPDALRSWRVVETKAPDPYTRQRDVQVYDETGALRSSRYSTRATDAEILADLARDVGVTSQVARFMRKNPSVTRMVDGRELVSYTDAEKKICPSCGMFAVVPLTESQLAAQPDNTTHVCHPAFGGCNQGFGPARPKFDGSKRQAFPAVKRPRSNPARSSIKRGDTVAVAYAGKHNLRVGATARVIEVHPDGMVVCDIHGATAHVPAECLLVTSRGVKENPPLVVLGNPGKSRGSKVLSKNIHSLRYQHAEDGEFYEHKFKRGSYVELLPDGSIRVYNPRGVKLWGDY